MLKVNYIDDPNILLGYPIIQNQIPSGRKTRLEIYPIPELLTYDGFKAQNSLQGQMVQQFYNFNLNNQNMLKSANNEYYNNWLPIYINKDHYTKNKNTILRSIAQIANNNVINPQNIFMINNINNNNNQFNPEQIFQVFPVILNSMIIGMYKGKTTLSSSYINCYFHFILLFKKMCQEYEVEYSLYLNDIFAKIKENKYSVNKTIIPDIGNFFMVLLFNKVDINTASLKKIHNALFEDFIIRQMYWMFHSEETRDHMKDLIIFGDKVMFYLDLFETDPSVKMNNLIKFNEDIHKKNIYDDIINIISTDEGYLEHVFIGKNKAKEQAEKRINQSFKRLFQECSKEGRNKLKEIIHKNLNFPEYFRPIQKTDQHDI